MFASIGRVVLLAVKPAAFCTMFILSVSLHFQAVSVLGACPQEVISVIPPSACPSPTEVVMYSDASGDILVASCTNVGVVAYYANRTQIVTLIPPSFCSPPGKAIWSFGL